ncbi:MAG: metallophosphoesterase [Candidatus Bathyarchaeota archaeon]|nr:metallophosphoesterase [Candidatus Bathyarchaeota archaeon]
MFTLLSPHPAALIKTDKKATLVIADPHLGWEMSLQEKGIHVPSQTKKLLKKLVDLLDKHKPDALIILGDVKYTVVTSGPGEWRDIPEFFVELKRHVADISIVRGNHDANLDPMLPENVAMHPATGLAVGDVGLFHGHKWPSPALLGCKTLFMGHLHPVVVFRDPAGFKITRQAWMRVDCDAQALGKTLLKKHGVKIEGTVEETLQKYFKVKPRATQLYIMPSFNDFLGGRPVNETRPQKALGAEALIGPVLRSAAVDVENSELYLLDGTYLGTLRQLKQLDS